MTGFTQVFGGTVIYPSDASYLALALTADTTLAWPSNTSSSPIAASIIDVTPSGAFTITLDDARLVSPGITILFNNLGPDTITVNKADGNAVLSIGPGEQWQIYLTSNATEAGSWRTFRYGAATAQAQAAALAGSGLEADGSVLDQAYPVTELSSTPYSLTAPDRAKAFVWTGALGTINLPTAAAAGNGWFVHVRNGGSGDLTLDPSGSETINDASTLVLQPGDSAVVVCGGAEWYTIGYGQQPVFAFDYTSIAVTTGTYTLSGSELNRIAYKFTGVLTGNVTVVVPATIQQYWVNNATTGAFTLSLQAAGSGSSTAVNQGETAILYCDGTAIISATTSAPFAGTLPVAQGGTGGTTAADARTNLGATGIGSSVFTAATTAAARTAISAAASGANSDITSLSGLTTPLTVGQGGTGSATAGGARTNLGAAASGANSDITSLSPAGGLFIGAATGGAQGAGTLNATGLFINGVAVGTGSGSVTSVAASGGTTGLSFTGSPITTSGTLTLSGTLGVANGGTGQTSYTDGQLLIGNSTGNTLAKSTLTAGSGISITNGGGSITIAATGSGGTVTSVSGSGGTTGLTLTGGPITGSGTLTLGGTLAVANGGTGASSASGARLNLDAPSTTGGGASGTWGISISGNAATATSAGSVTNGVYTTGNQTIGGVKTFSSNILLADGGFMFSSDGGQDTGISWASDGVMNVRCNATTVGQFSSTGFSGNAANVTGVVAVANGGTGASNAATALSNLGAYPSSNPSGYTSNTGTVTSVSGTGSVNGLTLTGTVTSSGNITLGGAISSVAGGATIDGVTIGYRSIPRSTTSGTAAVGDVGKCIAVSAGITIPNSTFAAGDVISIYNDSASSITITAGVTTLRQAGTTNTGNRTLAARGMATVWFNSSTEAVISGAGLS